MYVQEKPSEPVAPPWWPLADDKLPSLRPFLPAEASSPWMVSLRGGHSAGGSDCIPFDGVGALLVGQRGFAWVVWLPSGAVEEGKTLADQLAETPDLWQASLGEAGGGAAGHAHLAPGTVVAIPPGTTAWVLALKPQAQQPGPPGAIFVVVPLMNHEVIVSQDVHILRGLSSLIGALGRLVQREAWWSLGTLRTHIEATRRAANVPCPWLQAAPPPPKPDQPQTVAAVRATMVATSLHSTCLARIEQLGYID